MPSPTTQARPSTREEARARAARIRQSMDALAHSPRPEREASTVRSVYFIRAANGLIKIGASMDPRARLRTLATLSPVPLTLVAAIPGAGIKGESELHQKFAEHRSHGEWFHPSAELLDYIEGIS